MVDKSEEKSWFVYLVECLDGSFYCGVTNNIEKRMDAHKSGSGSKYVKAKGFGELLHFVECADKYEAFRFEYEVKQLDKWDKIAWFVEKKKLLSVEKQEPRIARIYMNFLVGECVVGASVRECRRSRRE